MTDIKEAQGLEIFTVPDWYLADCRKNPCDKDVVLLSDATAVIDQLREELAKAHEYGYQYRQERNRAQQELAALKSAPVVMPEQGGVSDAACRKLLFAFALECNTIGLTGASENLFRGMKDAIAISLNGGKP